MDRPAFGIPPFSTDVGLWLEGSWGRWPLRQVCDTFLIAEEPRQLPEVSGDIVISIDGQVFRRRVRLPEGMKPTHIETPIGPDDDIPF